ncbi:MAG: dTDP-4-dehydrorhamnose reductase [Pyrinomonadaceae bacterium]
MKILITGANGMVARATIGHCHSIGDEVIGLTRQDLDISDLSAVKGQVAELKPDAIINCAAYTDVDGAESNTEGCYAANADGVENLAFAAKTNDCRFVTISTDYVFDGTKPGFYTQRDTPNPLGVYASAKYSGEIRARKAYSRSIIVRSGWIYGRGGTNFLSVIQSLLNEGKTIKAISDSYGTPTFADDLAVRLRQIVDLDLPCIYHVTNAGEGTSYFGFAQKLCEIGEYDSQLVQPVSKDDLRRPAPRPVSSKLACLLSEELGLPPVRSWESAIKDFVKK